MGMRIRGVVVLMIVVIAIKLGVVVIARRSKYEAEEHKGGNAFG